MHDLPEVLHPDPAAHGYPRPQLERADWWSLNGPWEFALETRRTWARPADVVFDRTILVPFAPECAASGIGHDGFLEACWYRRPFEAPPLGDGERLLLHFGAVDYHAIVWLDGTIVARHEGGYTPFSADLTERVVPGRVHELVVRAEDDPHDLAKPRGKQDWQREPHSIWYVRTSGIWQTVWLERVPPTRVTWLRWAASLDRWELSLDLRVEGPRAADGLRVKVRLHVQGHVLADDTYLLVAGEVHRRIALSDPGIDDSRNDLLWSPERPTLIEADIELWGGRGQRLDAVRSYTALRQVTTQGDRLLLNGRPYYLRLVLDQGYWPHTGMTAPSDRALRHDVELAKAMGFNGVRKHQKVEDPRYLHWADRLGLLVWGEMPSVYRFTRQAIERVTTQWMEVIARDASHPCLVAWVPFNESWGVPDLPTIAEQRHWVAALYHLTNTLDATRPVIGNDGWESVQTDILAIHDYDHDPDRIARRYRSDEELPRILERERPGGRRLVVEGQLEHLRVPVMLTEFGGIAYHPDPGHTWGYSAVRSAEELQLRYAALLAAVHGVALFAGFCYTQFTDTYQEANGLLRMDRSAKLPLPVVRAATMGHDPGIAGAVPGVPIEGVVGRAPFGSLEERVADDDAPPSSPGE